MVKLFPVIKLNQPSIRDVWKGLPVDCIFVRLQDLICQDSFKFNKTFYEIKAAGGINKYLGFDKPIILSAIMNDRLIPYFNEERYADAINIIQPEYYTTPDGETYEGEISVSQKEIKRCLFQTANLLDLCPQSKPLGQVKGCTPSQIYAHIYWLKQLGINDFVFHMGDFFRFKDKRVLNRAYFYASLIRRHANKLILCGVSAPKNMDKYSFADAYGSLGYFVKATYGQRYVADSVCRTPEPYSIGLVKDNLKEMITFAQNLKRQPIQQNLFAGGVCTWEEVLEEAGLATLEIPVMPRQKR